MDTTAPVKFVWINLSAPPAPVLAAISNLRFDLQQASLPEARASALDSAAAVLLWINDQSSARISASELADFARSDAPPLLFLAENEEVLSRFHLPFTDFLLLSEGPDLIAAKLRFFAELHRRYQSVRHQRREAELALHREISAREEAQSLFEKHTTALAKLSRSRALAEADLSRFLQEICEAASALEPERVTVWIYDATGSLVHCVAHYRPPRPLDCSGEKLTAVEFPNYFAAFDRDRVCRVSDTEQDDRGRELREGRSSEPPIRAFLAASFSVRDQRTGILRVDQLTGPRSWTNQEQAFLTSLADMLALVFEASERKQTEQALRQSEQQLRLVLDNATEFAVLLLDPTGLFTECNSGAESILGYPEWEITGQHSALIFTDEDKAAGVPEKELRSAAANGRSTDERWHRRKDGSIFWGSGFMYSLRNPDGQLLGFVKIIRDITDRKLKEDRAQFINEELEKRVDARTLELKRATEQMEAFCYTVSHDLRAPLRSIHSFSAILIDEFASPLGAAGADLLERIKTSADRMDTLISDLLEYSRLGRLELPSEQVDLEDIVRGSLEDLSEEIRLKQAEIFVQHPLPFVCGNRAALTHVVSNLLTNALKFSKPGIRPEIKIFTEVNEGWARFSVQDNGIGIAPEYRERIFRIFERLHGVGMYPGTGVGLAIVKKSIERLGGKSGVESEPGVGSTFWFELKLPEQR